MASIYNFSKRNEFFKLVADERGTETWTQKNLTTERNLRDPSLPAHTWSSSTAGGTGGNLAALSLEIDATEISQHDNGDARREVGVEGGRHRMRAVGCSEHGDLIVWGAGWWHILRELSDLLVGIYDLRRSEPLAISFPHHSRDNPCSSSSTPWALSNWQPVLPTRHLMHFHSLTPIQ